MQQEGSASSERATPLEYAARNSGNNLRALVVTPLLGTVLGGLLGLVPYGAFCGLFGVGFCIGAMSTYLASSHRIVFGVAANVIAVTAFIVVTCAYEFTHKLPISILRSPGMVALLLGMFVIPGSVGSLIVAARTPAAA